MGSWLFYPAEDEQNQSIHERNEYDNEENIYFHEQKSNFDPVNTNSVDPSIYDPSGPSINADDINCILDETISKTKSKSRIKMPPINDVVNNKNDDNPSSRNDIIIDGDKDKGYSASAASSGSGFHGETRTSILNRSARDLQPLPTNATEILITIENYLNGIKSNEEIMTLLNDSDKRFVNNVWDIKLKNNLNDLIESDTMSNTAYDALKDIFEGLESKKYDIANKKITEITKNTKEWKINKKWITSFKSLVRICKKHKI